MKACIYSGSVSVLVNGSPTVDFNIEKGLRQGDPLAPFLFLIVAEGLSRLVRSTVNRGVFMGYSVNENISFPILQFADGTILLCEATWANLWATKMIFRTFEMVSGLRVNFFKNSLFGINIEDHFLNCASEFLSCCIGALPFKFLGIPVAANPRRCSTWEPIVIALKKKLQCWKGRFLSIGGRVSLIDSILNSLLLYLLSFYRASRKVVKTLQAIQRRFLWGGCDEVKKVCWVSWRKVCLPKKLGGLGVKCIDLFNKTSLQNRGGDSVRITPLYGMNC